jgi:hypothetical protein
MKKLLFIIPLLIWVSCEDENCECESTDESSSIIGLWEERISYDEDGIEVEIDPDDIAFWFDISAESYTEIILDEFVGFTNWGEGEPNNAGNGQDCGQMWDEGEWDDSECDETKPFIMEIDSLLNDPLISNQFVSVDSLNGSYYYLSTGWVTWHEADTFSVNAGGHLVSVTSETENSFIYNNIMQEYGVPVAWIGFNDVTWEGYWEWTTGERDSSCYNVSTIVNDSINGWHASFDFFGEDSAALVYNEEMFETLSFKAYDDSAYVYIADDETPPYLLLKLIRIESYDFTPVCE